MRVVVVVVWLVAACGFTPSAATSDGSVADSRNPDSRHDAAQGCESYSTQLDTCMIGSGANLDLTLSGSNSYNTDTHVLTESSATSSPPHVVVMTSTGPVDVLFVGSFTLGGTFRITGSNAFGIAAAGGVTIDGTIDLTNAGAGARTDAQCGAATGMAGMQDASGGGGGGGGAFHGNGGGGGQGDSDNGPSTGGDGGTSIARPAGLLGGCDGGKGGDAGGNGGNGGDGGGAIVIAAHDSISVTGNINVGGGGGHKGNKSDGGGGGGGSGGMILLESATVTISGVLAANGGGGAEGGDTSNDGVAGTTGDVTSTRAPGGSGNANEGGDGGGGGAGSTNDGVTPSQLKKGGGGGGGGGTGYIAIAGVPITLGSTISPQFASWP